MSEVEMLALLKRINIKIEALQAQMIMFQEALNPSLEYNTRVEETITKSNLKTDTEIKGGTSISPPKDHIIQDLDGIMILDKLPKSYLVAKGGYTTVVAYSHLKSGDGLVKGFQGNLNDDLHKDRKWILKTKRDGTPNLEWRPIGG